MRRRQPYRPSFEDYGFTADDFRTWHATLGTGQDPEVVRRINTWCDDQRAVARATELRRQRARWGGVVTLLVLITFPIPIVWFSVTLLVYNQGHVRPSWAAGLLGLFASCVTGSVAWWAGRKVDEIEKEQSGLR